MMWSRFTNRESSTLLLLLCFANLPHCLAAPVANKTDSGSLDQIKAAAQAGSVSAASLRLLYQNDLSSSTAKSHISGLLTGPVSSSEGQSQCASFSEEPMPLSRLHAHQDDFLAQFHYLCQANLLSCPAGVWIAGGAITVDENTESFTLVQASQYSGKSLPQLCTQSDNGTTDANSAPTSANEITVMDSKNNKYLGYRNKKAFRFLGVPYADKVVRFKYSTAKSGSGASINATEYGAECPQPGFSSSNENCLLLNIHTPYLSASSTSGLRPVLFYIHGGAFVTGSGGGSGNNGDNMASREDIVMVSIDYRLGTYGFMAAPNTDLTGNYGVSDMISALDWVIANIATFGGDPKRITIVGQSAGAAGVRILLGSPKSIGKFQGAIVMSNLGGAVDLGTDGDYGTSNSLYYNATGSYDAAGESVFKEAGCTQSTMAEKAACLTAYTGDLAALKTNSRFPVQDGVYITRPQLEVGTKGSNVANVPVMMGNNKNDGGSFVKYPKNCDTEKDCIADSLSISADEAEKVINSGLYPFYSTGNLTLDSFNVSQRVRTDDTFRCVDQATAYAAWNASSMGPVYYYQTMRTYGGYDPCNVDDDGPVSSAYPHGNPTEPYFRLHSGELGFTFGNQGTLRDDNDYDYLMLMTSYWASFVRTGNPNPSQSLLKARGYNTTLKMVQGSDAWKPVSGSNGPVMNLDYQPHLQAMFNQVSQCNWLGYPLNYYL